MKRLRLRDTRDHVSEEAVEAGSRMVPAKTIFVVVRGMILAKALPVAMAEVPMAFNQDMKAVVARPGIDPEYLLYALASCRNALLPEIGTSAHGTRRLGSSSLGALEIPIPPEREQRAIAVTLSIIQALTDIRTRTVEALKALKSATMAKLFREGLRAEPLKSTEIGEIPESWGVVRLGDVVQRMNYGTSVRCTADEVGRPVLRIPNIIHERIEVADLKYADLPDDDVKKLVLEPGDLLFVRTNGNRGYIGRCAVYLGIPTEALFASYLIRVRIDQDRLLPDFVQAYLSSLGREQITSAANSAPDGKYNLDTGTLRALRIPWPPVEEQRRIARAIQGIDAKVASATQRFLRQRELFDTALNQLLTGRRRLTPEMILNTLPGLRKSSAKEGGTPDETIVRDIVRRIVGAVTPEKIILFGSAARGEMGPDSDLDLLIVKSTTSAIDTAQAIRRCLRGVAPEYPKDVVVVSPEDVERYRDVVGTIIRPALREGRVVYAAA